MAARPAAAPAMRNEMTTAGPACGTDCESTMKIPEPTVSPTPNIVSRKTPRLRCNWSEAPSATGAPLTGRRLSICRCRLSAGVGMVPPQEHLWSPRRDGGLLSKLASSDQDIPAQGPDTASNRPWSRSGRPEADADLRGYQYLAVPVGVGEIVERRADVLEADVAGDHRSDIDVAFGDRPQRLAKLVRVVGENELNVDLLGDPEERVHGVGLHADADDDQPRAAPGTAHHVVDDAAHADGVEDHHRADAVERRTLGGIDGLVRTHRGGEFAPLR